MNYSKPAVVTVVLITLLFALLAGTSASTLAQERADSPSVQPLTGVVIAEALNVRSGPGVDFSAVGVVYKDDVLTISGRNDDAIWPKITWGDLSGWVSARHLRVDGDIVGLALVAPESGTAQPTSPSTPTPPATPSPLDLCVARANPDAVYGEVDKSDEFIGQTVAWKGKVFDIRET